MYLRAVTTIVEQKAQLRKRTTPESTSVSSLEQISRMGKSAIEQQSGIKGLNGLFLCCFLFRGSGADVLLEFSGCRKRVFNSRITQRQYTPTKYLEFIQSVNLSKVGNRSDRVCGR